MTHGLPTVAADIPEMLLSFTKMHGLGNDFVILDGLREPVEIDAAKARAIADRRHGVGCDQLLVLEPDTGGGADVSCRIFNSDGSEAGQCGNGARCISLYLRRAGHVNGAAVRIRFPAGILEGHLEDNGAVRMNMGVPELDPARIPMQARQRAEEYSVDLPTGAVRFAAVSMGNPHAVITVNNVDKADVESIGPALQQHGLFPDGVNVGFMQIIDRGHIRLRVVERGVGETLACGSGACAAVVAGNLQGRLDQEVEVQLKGGSLLVAWEGEDRPVWMTGPATIAFEGRIEL